MNIIKENMIVNYNGSNRCSMKIKVSCKICSPDTFPEHNKRKLYVKYVKVILYANIINLNIFVKYVKEVHMRT